MEKQNEKQILRVINGRARAFTFVAVLSKITDFTLYITASVVSYKATGKLRKTLEKESGGAS